MVVGGGSAGCALAGRLAAAGTCRVLLLEAGPVGWMPEILDVASLAATVPGPPRQLGASGRAAHRQRRARPARPGPRRIGSGQRRGLDARHPRRRLGPAGLDLGRTCWRATSGPRPTPTSATVPATARTVRCRSPGPPARCCHPTAERFLDRRRDLRVSRRARQERRRAARRGAGAGQRRRRRAGQPGDGLPARGARSPTGRRRRANAPAACCRPRPLTVRGDSPAERVVLDGTRAVGVGWPTARPSARARSCSPRGPSAPRTCSCGPGSVRRTTCAPPASRFVHDLPGVGRGFTDHPAVFLPFTTGDPPAHPHARAAQAALDLDAGADPAGDCEVLLFARPFDARRRRCT